MLYNNELMYIRLEIIETTKTEPCIKSAEMKFMRYVTRSTIADNINEKISSDYNIFSMMR